MRDYKQLNGLALAYVGDAIYEIYIRDYLVSLGQTKPNVLHRMATHYAVSYTHLDVYKRQTLFKPFNKC